MSLDTIFANLGPIRQEDIVRQCLLLFPDVPTLVVKDG